MIHQTPSRKSFSAAILDWYGSHARRLPWRSLPGEQPDPYHVWLSEIMLQQTTVATVGPYFRKFLESWPSITDMAEAPLDDILTAWAGLGYYARARNLHKCAIAVAREHNGVFPDNMAGLRALPGIGPYTAAAISAIAFGKAETVVDGNIERIISRLYRIRTSLPAAKKEITEFAAKLTPIEQPGDYAQALMDIGAGICLPRNPNCSVCPVSFYCAAFAAGDMENYPVKAPKKIKPTRRAVIFWLQRPDGHVLMRRRAEKGMLGGMMEFPSTDWADEALETKAAVEHLLQGQPSNLLNDISVRKQVRHTFTHFHLELQPVAAQLTSPEKLELDGAVWIDPDEFGSYALPTLMTKVVKAVLESR
ncbi:MAG: A/G-specific adenine glycosylase [Sneathiella sp.]|uniref:A/G-specific adenine glycosylase n=1 Tax=Sneathiella sp. TaxID=1964365 RepID=UPI000C500CEF|nr:A/G-specific adenine glycosylase [Sneathiella sp.]MAZ02934.1 A/G-specific adenine glycosylase [Sneathiella sp.]